MPRTLPTLLAFPLILAFLCACASSTTRVPPTISANPTSPYLLVLGIAQDGGVPQAGNATDRGWTDPAFRRRVSCLGLIDPSTGNRWMFDATPDFPTQLRDLCLAPPARPAAAPRIDGIFLTHAHIGHYTGLMYLGLEAMGAHATTVYAMPRMRSFLETSGPWSQLVNYQNIAITMLEAGTPVNLSGGLSVTPILVPHRQEFSEVVGYRIQGPNARALFIPDIDSWEQWDAAGSRLETELAAASVAYLDGTFFADGELPGRDMRYVPHPLIEHTMDRLSPLPAAERAKVRFIHLNHTNPALWLATPARRKILDQGFKVADEGEKVGL